MHQKGHVRRLSFGGAHGGGGVLRAARTVCSETLGNYKLFCQVCAADAVQHNAPSLFEAVGYGAARGARGAALGGLQQLPVSKKGGL